MTLKPKIVIYAVDSGGMPKGPKYQNPQWFDAVHKDAAKVIVVGDWPVIVETYRGLGIPVEVVDHYPPSEGVETVFKGVPVDHANSHAEIPSNWESLPWSDPNPGNTTIRFVAQQFTSAIVINRRHAAKIIRDELARRAAVKA